MFGFSSLNKYCKPSPFRLLLFQIVSVRSQHSCFKSNNFPPFVVGLTVVNSRWTKSNVTIHRQLIMRILSNPWRHCRSGFVLFCSYLCACCFLQSQLRNSSQTYYKRFTFHNWHCSNRRHLLHYPQTQNSYSTLGSFWANESSPNKMPQLWRHR